MHHFLRVKKILPVIIEKPLLVKKKKKKVP